MLHCRLMMQLQLALDDRPALLAEVHRRLLRRFGPQGPYLRLDPVSQLVLGLLGGRTSGDVSQAAFEGLLLGFASWAAVRDAPLAKIRPIVAAVTFAEAKAPRLKRALAAITAHDGWPRLDHLECRTVMESLLCLEQLPGVGRKVAAATLNFSTLAKAALVIDTHHLRVLCRLGFVGWRADLRQTYDTVMPLLPSSWDAAAIGQHHHLFKRLGQDLCRHAAPLCDRCPLIELCPTGRLRTAAGGSQSTAGCVMEEGGRTRPGRRSPSL